MTGSSTAAELVLWLLVAVPSVVGAALVAGRPRGRWVVPASLTTAALAVAGSLVVAGQHPRVATAFLPGMQLALGVDALSAFVVPTVTVVTLLVLLFARSEICRSRARFHGLMLLFAAAAVLTATAETLVALLLAWEVMGAMSYALIGFWWRDDDRVSAGLTAFLTTRTADLGLYVAAGAALATLPGSRLSDLPAIGGYWQDVAAAGILVAALGKAAQLPFSFWLSRAMLGPSSVSALLHSAAMVALGGYLLLRVQPLLEATGWAGPVAAWAGATTAVLMGLVAMAQRDLKQLLAASTSAQLAFIVLAAGVGSVAGGVAHLVAHAATKALLFLAAGAWLTALGTKQLAGLQGVARRWPVLGWLATAGAVALAGIPPLSLWATKDAVLSSALEESPALYAAGLIAAALSAAYAGKIVATIWRPVTTGEREQVEAHYDSEEQGTRTVGRAELAPLVVLALGALILGVLALPPMAGHRAQSLGEGAPPVSTLELIGSGGLAALVVVSLLRWRPPEPGWARDWLGLEPIAHRAVVRPTMRLARALARADDGVLDASVEAAARSVVALARRAADADSRWADGAVEGVARSARRLGVLARRPQTGQLYQYYVQAVVVLALGTVLVLTLR
jgi:NADH:ubiquinone oxidoreductase subunit 5 (subunit L)/multisubunit Na+/H+ antiporter MnhA subunit